MIGISTRIQESRHADSLFNSIAKWREFHPEENIVIVDSASPDKSYMEKVKSMDPRIIIEDIDNTGYESGAWWHIFNTYPNEERYFFFQDSMVINKPVDQFIPKSSSEVAICCEHGTDSEPHRAGWANDVGAKNWVCTQPVNCDYGDYLVDGNINFLVTVHCSFIVQRDTLEKIKSKNFDKVKVDCKLGSRAMERMWGIVFFHHEKLNEIVIPGNYISKEHGGR